MNWIDYTILAVLALSVLVGLWRGLISEVLSLATLLVAVWAAWLLGPSVAGRMTFIDLPAVRTAAGYAVCFILVLVLGALVRYLAHRLLATAGLSGTDRMLGMAFGLVRGVLLVCVMVFLAQFTVLTRDPPWQQSMLLPPFQRATIWLGQQVPAGVREHFQPADVSHAVRDKLDQVKVGDVLRKLPTATPEPRAAKAPAPAASVSSSNHP